MNAHYFRPKCLQLWLAIIVSALVTGCATGPFSKSGSHGLSDIEGKWYWQQNQGPWNGFFVLEKAGDSYAGKLDDTFEATYGDRIVDVDISGDHIKFTRDGQFGNQYWEGTLKVKGGRLKIIDGRWRKQYGSSGSFYAERSD